MQSYLDQIVNAMNLEREKEESDDYEERTAKAINGMVADLKIILPSKIP